MKIYIFWYVAPFTNVSEGYTASIFYSKAEISVSNLHSHCLDNVKCHAKDTYQHTHNHTQDVDVYEGEDSIYLAQDTEK
jgi:hypothetical protein